MIATQTSLICAIRHCLAQANINSPDRLSRAPELSVARTGNDADNDSKNAESRPENFDNQYLHKQLRLHGVRKGTAGSSHADADPRPKVCEASSNSCEEDDVAGVVCERDVALDTTSVAKVNIKPEQTIEDSTT